MLYSPQPIKSLFCVHCSALGVLKTACACTTVCLAAICFACSALPEAYAARILLRPDCRQAAAAFIDLEAEASGDEEEGYDDDCEGDSQQLEDDEMFDTDLIDDTTPARGSQAPRG